MKPQNQTHPHSCLQSCIATLLDYRMESVPDFVHGDDHAELDENGYPRFWVKLQAFLKELGLSMIEFRISGSFMTPGENGEPEELPILVPWQPLPFSGYCILVGRTKSGVRHMIVGKTAGDTFAPVHDPHPDKPGVVQLEGVCFLVPLDPSVFMKMGATLGGIKRITSGTMNQAKWAAITVSTREALGESIIVS